MNGDADPRLRETFRSLRHAAEAGAPAFRDIVLGLAQRRERTAHRRRRVVTLVVAAAATLLLVTALRSGGKRTVRVDLAAARWEAPTDFLLRLPGAELLRTIPTLDTEWRITP